MANTVRSSPFRCLLPWNIRCSKRCAKPLRPLRSFTAPTWYQRSTATTGARWSSDSITVRPLGSWYFSNGTCGSAAAAIRMAASMGCSYYRPGWSRATDDLRGWGSRISRPVTTCVEDAHCRTDQIAADDLFGPVRAGSLLLLADHGARLGPGFPGPGHRHRSLSPSGKNPA